MHTSRLNLHPEQPVQLLHHPVIKVFPYPDLIIYNEPVQRFYDTQILEYFLNFNMTNKFNTYK